jgi:hypothetical protein
MQNTQQLYIVLNDSGVDYRIISGQTAIIPGTTYYVTVGVPQTPLRMSGYRPTDLYIKDDNGMILSSATLTPHPKDPRGRSVGSLVTDPEAYRSLFPYNETTARARLFICEENGTAILSSEITIARPVFDVPKPSTDMIWYEAATSGIVFTDTKEIKAWLKGTFVRSDHLLPQDLPVGCPVHTHCEGSFLALRKLDEFSTISADFVPVATGFPINGFLRITSKGGEGGFEAHRKDVYDGDYVRYGIDGITAASAGTENKFTFDAEDTGIVTRGFLKSVLVTTPGGPEVSGEVALKLAALEQEVQSLRAELAATKRLTAGDGIYINYAGEISLEKNVPEALSVFGYLGDDSTIGDVAAVAHAAVSASK